MPVRMSMRELEWESSRFKVRVWQLVSLPVIVPPPISTVTFMRWSWWGCLVVEGEREVRILDELVNRQRAVVPQKIWAVFFSYIWLMYSMKKYDFFSFAREDDLWHRTPLENSWRDIDDEPLAEGSQSPQWNLHLSKYPTHSVELFFFWSSSLSDSLTLIGDIISITPATVGDLSFERWHHCLSLQRNIFMIWSQFTYTLEHSAAQHLV